MILGELSSTMAPKLASYIISPALGLPTWGWNNKELELRYSRGGPQHGMPHVSQSVEEAI